jgi:ribonuclease-3
MIQGFTYYDGLRQFIDENNLPVNDLRLLRRALTHRSYLNEHPEALEDNERLEFLGDAVLDFLVGAWLYNHFPELKEGDLTKLRSALVRTDQLANFARQLHLDSLMLLGHGENEAGGRERIGLLCATYEAVIGALYLEAGIEGVENFIVPNLEKTTSDFINKGNFQDPKSLLQEWAQAKGFGTPVYRTESSSGPEHDKTFEVVVIINSSIAGSGKGHSKQAAAKKAASDALNRIKDE